MHGVWSLLETVKIPGFNDLVDSDLKVDIVKIQGAVIVVSLKGLIDTYNTPFLSKKVNLPIGYGYDKIVFNLFGVTYMSSTGIGIFTTFLRQLRSMRGDFVLASVPQKIKDVFELIGFSSFFNFAPDTAEAIAMLDGSAPEEVKSPFPKIFRCTCRKKLKVSKPGKFRCPQCRSVISVNKDGTVRKLS